MPTSPTRGPSRHHLCPQRRHNQAFGIRGDMPNSAYHPVTGGCGRHLARQRAEVFGAAGAPNPVHVVLADLDVNLRQIVHLMRALDTHIVRIGQIRPTPATTVRAVRHPLIGRAHPRHRVALRARLFPPPAPRTLRPLRRRLRPARKIITGGRHRRVAAVARGLPLQPPDPLLQHHVGLAQLQHQSDQLLARQLLQPGHNARSSQLTARSSRPTRRRSTTDLNAYPRS